MTEILTFSECLKKLMQRDQLAMGQLAALCGGRTTIKQILAGNGTHAQRERLLEKLKEAELFFPEDFQKLSSSLEISRVGIKDYLFQQDIEQLFHWKAHPAREPLRNQDGTPLTQWLSSLATAGKIDILCVNSCFQSVADVLLPLFQSSQNIRMWHFLHSRSFRDLRYSGYLNTFFPLLFDGRYHPYGLESGADSDVLAVGGNQLVIRARWEGKWKEWAFSLANEVQAYELPSSPGARWFALLSSMLRGMKPTPKALRESMNDSKDLHSLCMTFLSHELNRAIYSLGNDVFFQQIPPKILCDAIVDKGVIAPEELNRLYALALPIHERRYRNQYEKKKETYQIMTVTGCQRFLDTGLCVDHFYAMRPFTPRERAQIFGQILSAARQNPLFVPLLAKDARLTYRYSLICYEKLGLSLDLANADYNTENGYRSTFLLCPNFTQPYTAYYLKRIAGERCYSREESLKKLQELYAAFLKREGLKA